MSGYGASLSLIGESNPGKLPAFIGREEISVGHADMTAGGGTRTAAQDHLVDHELAVVFAQRPWTLAVAGIGQVRAPGPLPGIAQHLHQRPGLRRCWQGVKVLRLNKVPRLGSGLGAPRR